jgi:hypothetical protein
MLTVMVSNQETDTLTMIRGTKVVLNINPVVALCEGKDLERGDIAKVSSRKKNGWLRVTVQRTGKTISVRNCAGKVDRHQVVASPRWPELQDNPPRPVAWSCVSPAEAFGSYLATKKEEDNIAKIIELKQIVAKQREWLARAISIIKEYQTRYPSGEAIMGMPVAMPM